MQSSELDELYQAIILDHFKHPRNQALLISSNCACQKYNPLCGDRIELKLSGDNDLINAIQFSAKGCAISQASASIMSELCKGQSASEILKLSSAFHYLFELPEDANREARDKLGDALVFQTLSKFPARQRCALLPWEAMQDCLANLK